MTTILTRDTPATGESPPLGTIRGLLLALVLLGCVGILSELVLLEHTASATQWIPVVILAVGLVVGVVVAISPSRRAVRAFQAMMGLVIATGLLGLYLHYRGNAEFELEMDASARGMGLMWQSLRGATPALAPGAMVLLGLLGLIQAYRHPAVRKGARSTATPAAASPDRRTGAGGIHSEPEDR